MSITSFSTSNMSFGELLSNSKRYIIPPFQRDYSWGDDQWEDLWLDIQNVAINENETEHYMGYLVLQTKGDKTYRVIDGQQRLTTLSILILSGLRIIQDLIDNETADEGDGQRIEGLRRSFIGSLDYATLLSENKLELNRNNNSYYKDELVTLKSKPNSRGLNTSERRMLRVYGWYRDAIKAGMQSGAEIASLIQKIGDRLVFTVIQVDNALNAYKVFETLNARGVKLSSTDLLKNYLFSVVDGAGGGTHALNELERYWNELVAKLGNENFPVFLRAHWNSRHKHIRKVELFKRIREQIKTKADTFSLVNEMREDIEPYMAFRSAEDELWRDSPERRRYIKLLRTFNVSQIYPLLLCAYRKLDSGDFTRLLKSLVVISFRYNVISNKPANEQERVYNMASRYLNDEMPVSFSDLIKKLAPVYPDDSAFKAAFTDKVLRTTEGRNKKVVRYILFALEEQLTHDRFDIEDSRYTIEHIAPENPDDNWRHIDDVRYEQFTYRLGNMTLLEAAQNRDIGNAEYNVKREAFRDSTFEITRAIAERNDRWDEERIATRQEQMAEQAVQIWRIEALS